MKLTVLHDTETVNPGDVAIGQVERDFFEWKGAEVTVAGPDYSGDGPLVIGGGHLLQAWDRPFYRGFRRHGPHRLHAMGVTEGLQGLEYLNEYRVVSVRTGGDRELLLRAAGVEAGVYPCPANLVRREDSGIKLPAGTIGLQTFYPKMVRPVGGLLAKRSRPLAVFSWRRSIREGTLDDLVTAKRLASSTGGTLIKPGLTPGQLLDVIAQLDLFVCQSLHAAMWARQVGTSFLVHRYAQKISLWARERGLEWRTWMRPEELPRKVRTALRRPIERGAGDEDRRKATEGLEALWGSLEY